MNINEGHILIDSHCTYYSWQFFKKSWEKQINEIKNKFYLMKNLQSYMNCDKETEASGEKTNTPLMSFRALGPSRDWSASYMTLQKSCSAKVGAWPSFCRLRANMKSKFALSSPRSLGVCRLLFLSCLSCSSTEVGKKRQQLVFKKCEICCHPLVQAQA